MSLLSGLFGPSAAVEDQTAPGSRWSSTTLTSSEVNSLTLPAVFSCVRLLAESVATLPCITYRRVGSDRERVTDDARATMLRSKPNPMMTEVEFYEAVMGHLLLWGNAYLFKRRGTDGKVAELYPLVPVGAFYRRDEDGTRWFYQGTGERYRVEDVMHIRAFGPDGLYGYSPVSLFRQTFSVGKSQEAYADGLWRNQARPGGVLKTDRELSDASFERLKAEWNQAHEGVQKHGKTAFLENGVTWQALGMPPEDAQFLEQRKFNEVQVASIFRVPPHKIGNLDRATFSNIEQQSIDFVTDSLRPWLRRLEARLAREVYDDPVRDADLYCEFLVDALLRGETKTRYEAYAQGLNNGFLTTNEVRRAENLAAVDGGDVLFKQLNTTPLITNSDGDVAEPDPTWQKVGLPALVAAGLASPAWAAEQIGAPTTGLSTKAEPQIDTQPEESA